MTSESTLNDQDERSANPISRPSKRREVVFLLSALTVYFAGRAIVEGSEGRARSNALSLLRLEHSLGIDVEPAIQEWALESALVREVGNLSYVWLHWPFLVVAAIFLYLQDTNRYLQFRNALFLSGGIGLILFGVLPAAPPRFMPGFTGTVSDDARRHYLNYPLSWANEFAAFPSFHVGWTLIASLAVAATFERRLIGAVALLPGILVGVSVVTTGNHYILDSVAGALIAAGAYAWFGRRDETGDRLERSSSFASE